MMDAGSSGEYLSDVRVKFSRTSDNEADEVLELPFETNINSGFFDLGS